MALQVWLPLTKDTRNQGISGATVTNSGATFDSAGKLGGCYTFGSGKYMRATPASSLMQAKAVSVACWVKITSWNSSYDCLMSWADETAWTNSRVTLARNNTSSNLRFTIADGTNYAGVNCTTTLALNTWYHVVGTYDGSNIKIYINGNLEGTAASTLSIIYAGTFNIGGWSGNNYPINGSLNDIRLYNHCLSPLEIKQISQGLVLHYPLNRNGWGQENLGNFASVVSNWIMENLSGSNYTDSSYGNVIKLITSSTNQRMYNYVPTTMWQSGKVYTVSFLAKADINSRTCDMSRSIADFSPSFTLSTDWKRYSGKITSTSTPNGGTLSFRIHQSGATVYITQIKVEEGEIATPYCPGSAETAYTSMGLNGTTEYDTSGFCNNGTRTGTFTWTSDTPKYAVSTVFTGSQRIEAPWNPSGTTSFTIAGWFYNSSGTTYYGAKNTYNTYVCLEQSRYFVYNSSASAYVGNYTSTRNKWQHIVLVHDAAATKLKLYVDGNFISEVTTNGTIYNSDILDIGGRQGSAQYDGKMSDFRIYATALSASDVKSLYQNCATIDADGTIHGQIRS